MGLGAKSSAAAAPRQVSPSDYQQLVPRIRESVRDVVPPGATVLMVSRGDEELVKLEGLTAWHFMREPDGRYVGYHPADSDQAIAHLEELRGDGADYLVVPSTAFWWLQHYDEFFRHLDRFALLRQDYDCLVFHLAEGATGQAGIPEPGAESAMDPRLQRVAIEHFVANLLPSSSTAAFLSHVNDPIAPIGCRAWRPTKTALGDAEQVGRASLLEMAEGGFKFVVIPRNARQEWVRQIAATLDGEHRLVMRQQHVCEIYELRAAATQPAELKPAEATPAATTPAATTPAPTKRPFWQRLGFGSAGNQDAE